MLVEASLICLALNVYHEARDQPLVGQYAVAEVVLNRVYDIRFPHTVCEVVKQGPTYTWKKDLPVRNRCQFSWYCDGKSDKPKDKAAWRIAQSVARDTLTGKPAGNIGYATHYHSVHVRPSWASSKVLIGKIGDHIFYRWSLK